MNSRITFSNRIFHSPLIFNKIWPGIGRMNFLIIRSIWIYKSLNFPFLNSIGGCGSCTFWKMELWCRGKIGPSFRSKFNVILSIFYTSNYLSTLFYLLNSYRFSITILSIASKFTGIKKGNIDYGVIGDRSVTGRDTLGNKYIWGLICRKWRNNMKWIITLAASYQKMPHFIRKSREED